MSEHNQPTRRPYHGSCHCGHIKYLVYLTAPSTDSTAQTQPQTRFYKCNCSTCQKAGFFHTRPPSPGDDFFLLSPAEVTNPTEMGDYMCFDRLLHWYFCPRCGVRCFITEGCWRSDFVDLSGVDVPEGFRATATTTTTTTGDGQRDGKVRVLRADMGALGPDQKGYLSVNAHTLDQDQVGGQGLDLRELVDRKWMSYLDCKDEKGEPRVEYPHEGGTW